MINNLAIKVVGICAATFLMFLPHHHTMRLITSNEIVFGWIELLQFVSMCCIGIHFLFITDRFWKKVIVVYIFSCFLVLSSVNLESLFLSLRGFMRVVGVFAPMLVLPFLVTEHCERNSKLFRLFYTCFTINVIFISLWLLVEASLGLGGKFHKDLLVDWAYTRGFTRRAFYAFDSPMVAGQWMWMFGCLLIFLIFPYVKNRIHSLLVLSAGFLSFFATFPTISRGPWILVAISVVCYFLINLQRGVKSLVYIIFLGAAICLSSLVFASMNADIRDSVMLYVDDLFDTDERANEGRLYVMSVGARAIYDALPFGYGLSQFAIGSGESSLDINNFENTYLNYMVNLGLAGFYFALVVIAIFLSTIVRGAHFIFVRRLRDPVVDSAFVMSLALFLYTFASPLCASRAGSMVLSLVLIIGVYANLRINIMTKKRYDLGDRL
ncbi:MAG: O-antigen ligase family protein [Opitutales bacterium]